MPRVPGRSTPRPSRASATTAEPLLSPGGRRPLRSSFPSAATAERRTLGAIVGVIVTIWLVVVFGRALADANVLAQRQAREEAVNAQLRAQVAAGRAEIAYIQTDEFLSFVARAFGMGAARERAFALQQGAPAPRAIIPLGAAEETPTPTTPLEDWLALLFGS